MQISSAPQTTPTGAPQPMSATPTTAAPTGSAAAMMGTITTVHLVLIAVLALMMIAAIIYGAAQRRKRRAAEREEQARVESLGGAELLRVPEPVTIASGQEEQRPAVALRPTPADLPGRGARSTPEPVLAPVAPIPRHDPIPPREPVAAPPVVAAPADAPLTRIKGLGPKVQSRLAELGITRVDQIAALTDDQADALDAQLGAFRGRIARDRWVEQARFLAAGDVRGFEAVFGRL